MITALLIFLFAATTADVTVVQFPAKGRVSLSLGGKNKAEVERLATVTRVSVQLEGLLSAQGSKGEMNCYVVWAVSPENTFDNLGELAVNGAKGSLEATTRFDRFAILVTAEPHQMVDKPSSRVLFKNEASREFPGVPLMIEVGTYDYSGVPATASGVPPLMAEARAALAISTLAQAATRAEAEYRQAKVASDTMEELARRVSPPDVVDSAALGAIRRAQRATMSALQSAR
jgi:hypothetical protein